MIRYYKLFDLLNRRGMNKSSLLEILSSKTIAKLSKGENVNSDVINKICLFLECQPGDIMEIVEVVKTKDEEVLYEKPIMIDDIKSAEEIIEPKPHEVIQLREESKI